MSGFLIANTLLFLIVTAYAVYLFVYLVKTRLVYIRLGKKNNLINGLRNGFTPYG